MILQGSLRLEYNGESFSLMVKTILKNGAYYFYVSDKEREKPLLSGETLELTFIDSFSTLDKEEVIIKPKVTVEIISAIQNMLLENKQLWFY